MSIIFFDLANRDKREVIQELAQKLVVFLPRLNCHDVLLAILEGENK